MILVIAFVAICGIGVGSSYFLGPDNFVEEEAETLLEDMIIVQIDIPGEAPVYGWLDLSPATPEKKNAYITND